MFAIFTKTTKNLCRNRAMGYLVTYRVLGIPVYQQYIEIGALNNGLK